MWIARHNSDYSYATHVPTLILCNQRRIGFNNNSQLVVFQQLTTSLKLVFHFKIFTAESGK